MAETITMPKLGFDMSEGTLVRWVKNEGDNILKGDILAEIETDKATVEVESSATGVVRKLLVDPGAVVPIGAPIAIVGSLEEKIEMPPASEPQKNKQTIVAKVASPAPQATSAPQALPNSASSVAIPIGPVKASPLAKKIARDHRLDLSRIQGTGPGNRIVRVDVESALVATALPAGSKAASSYPLLSLDQAPLKDEAIELTKLRQAIARRMAESKATVPHFYVTRVYSVDSLMALRKQVNELLAEDQKLSVNDFIIKAVGLTLRQFPNLNASFAGDKVLHHGAVNVGVAVAIEGGLLTVVNRDTDQKSLRQISADLKRMVAGAREGKVKSDDIQGSTFSISNLGMYDVENFIAIVNPPEAAILAVGMAQETPVVEQGQLKIGWRMKATISVDHRVSDGAEAARFLQVLASFLEEPLKLLL